MINIYSLPGNTGNPIVKLKSINNNCWIHIVEPTEDEIKHVSSKFKIPLDFFKDALDEDSMPDVYDEKEDGFVFMITRVPFYDKDKEVITVPLGVFIPTKKNCVITICRGYESPTHSILEKAPKHFSIKNQKLFLIGLFKTITKYYNRHLSIIEKEIDQVEKTLRTSLDNKEVAFLLSLRKTLVYFRTSIVGNKKVAEKLFSGKILKMNSEEKELFEDVLIEISETQHLIDIYAEILRNTLEAYSSIVSNNLNSIMKLLALLTISISLPTMIASIYGMNVNLPMQGNPASFWYLLVLSVLLAVISMLYFKYKRWM